MKRFYYTAFKIKNGEKKFYSDSVWAKDEDAALAYIKKLGYEVDKIQPAVKIKKLSSEDLLHFIRELKLIVKGDIELSKGLEEIKRSSSSKEFKIILDEIKSEIEKGSSLGESLEKRSKYFPDFLINLIKAGEASGDLYSPLNYISIFLLKRTQIRKKIFNVCFYPFLLLILFFIQFGVIFYFLPEHLFSFSLMTNENPYTNPNLFSEYNYPLVIKLNMFVKNHLYDIFGIIICFVLMLYLIIKQPKIKRFLHHIKFALPLFGRIFSLEILYRFSYLFGTMLNLKISPLVALKIVHNMEFDPSILPFYENAINIINKGGKITGGFFEKKIFPRSVSWILTNAENRGDLEKALLEVSDYAEAEIDDQIIKIRILEPFLLIFVGALMAYGYIFILSALKVSLFPYYFSYYF